MSSLHVIGRLGWIGIPQQHAFRAILRQAEYFNREKRKMLLQACKAKIHQATVTQAELNYVGSITIDEALMDAAGLIAFQYLNVTSLANGVFWRTYVMPGERDSGVICLNGPPAHHFKPGDKIIIIAEVLVEPNEMPELDPVVVFVDEKNKIVDVVRHREKVASQRKPREIL